MLVSVECQGAVQGLMAVLRSPQRSRRSDNPLFYVDYLEAAPWNLKVQSVTSPVPGCWHSSHGGSRAASVWIWAWKAALACIRSHKPKDSTSLGCGMAALGPDSNYFDLTYFEFTGPEAVEWLAAIGGI